MKVILGPLLTVTGATGPVFERLFSAAFRSVSVDYRFVFRTQDRIYIKVGILNTGILRIRYYNYADKDLQTSK